MINNVRYNVTCDICNERIPVICSYTFKVGDDNFGYDTICTVCKTCKEKIITAINHMKEEEND